MQIFCRILFHLQVWVWFLLLILTPFTQDLFTRLWTLKCAQSFKLALGLLPTVCSNHEGLPSYLSMGHNPGPISVVLTSAALTLWHCQQIQAPKLGLHQYVISNSELLDFQVYKDFGKGSKDYHQNDFKWEKLKWPEILHLETVIIYKLMQSYNTEDRKHLSKKIRQKEMWPNCRLRIQVDLG